MDYESFIDNDFFSSKEFKELLKNAKEKQIETAKTKIDDFYFSQNVLRKTEINYEKRKANKRA